MTTKPSEAELSPDSSDGNHLSREEARLVVEDRLRPFLGSGLPAGLDLRRLSRYLTSRRYASGELIVRKGVRGDSLGVVAAGHLTSHTLAVRDRDPSLLGPAAVFGEAMLLRGWPSDSTLRAATDAQVYFLERSDLLAMGALGAGETLPPTTPRRLSPWLIWAAAALVVILGVAGLRFGLGFRLSLPIQLASTPQPASTATPAVLVQILSPATGALAYRAQPVPVRAEFADAALQRAELLVDGVGQGVQIPQETISPTWVAEWAWAPGGDGTHQLVVEARGATGEVARSEPVIVTLVPDGELLFASTRSGTEAVFALRLDGQDARPLTPQDTASRQPAWGRHDRLAFVSLAASGQTEIWIMDPATSDTRKLVVGRDPAWSFDGTRLAYAAGVESTSQVFVTSGETAHQMTAEAVYAGQPAWSPDGTRLAYVAERDGNWDIWIAGLNRTDPVRVTEDPAMDWSPSWSPDGQQLAFVSNRGGSHQIYVMRADGSEVVQRTGFPQGAESPAWSPDGRWIAFVAYVGEGDGVDAREIYLMRPDGRDQLRLTHNTYDDSEPAWGPVP